MTKRSGVTVLIFPLEMTVQTMQITQHCLREGLWPLLRLPLSASLQMLIWTHPNCLSLLLDLYTWVPEGPKR